MRRSKLLNHLTETLAPYREAKLIVAVSGGLDSMTLLEILLRLQKKLNLTVVVAHADHGLRRSSAKVEAFVQKVAVGYGLPYRSTLLSLTSGGNLEARARQARYAWLEEVRKTVGADFIVTAHQADDQVETLFLHLTRGSGLAGLTGMQVQNGKILRPLLDVPRSTLARYSRRRKIAYRLDSTNRSLKFARNRIRRQIITSLQRLNPQLIETVSQSMRVFNDEYEVVRTLAEQELRKATVKQMDELLELSVPRMRRLKRGIRHLVWREALRNRRGSLEGFGLMHMENLDDLLKRQAGSLIHLPHGIIAHRRSQTIAFKQASDTAPPSPQTLPVPGEVTFGEAVIKASNRPANAKGTQTLIDVGKAGNKLTVRAPKTGDRIKPVGMRGSKLVSDLLTDAKVPRDERPWVPVIVTTAGEVIWVAGRRADRRFVPDDRKDGVVLSLTDPIHG